MPMHKLHKMSNCMGGGIGVACIGSMVMVEFLLKAGHLRAVRATRETKWLRVEGKRWDNVPAECARDVYAGSLTVSVASPVVGRHFDRAKGNGGH